MKAEVSSGIRSVAVFCGSGLGDDPRCAAAAAALGAGLAASGRRLIYGGGRNGMMGRLADAALGAGGSVVGVMPEFLLGWDDAHAGLSDFVLTDSMHTRKRRMYEEADAFVGLPGGIGTLDELIEVIVWRQLRQHDKPIVICNIAGSAAGLLGAIDAAIKAGFTDAATRGLFVVVDGVAAVLAELDRLPAGHLGDPERV